MKRLCWLLPGALLMTGCLPGQTSGNVSQGASSGPVQGLPESPGKVHALDAAALESQTTNLPKAVPASQGTKAGPVPCVPATKPEPGGKSDTATVTQSDLSAKVAVAQETAHCAEINPYQRFLSSSHALSLSPKQKGYLAVRDVVDPFNLLTIAGNSAFTIGFDAHSAYGPGIEGFGRNVGVSLLQDVTGEFIGTFGVCSLFHQDPHYHRLPQASPGRRVMHAIVRTVVAQSDDGKLIPNYANLITYPASAEISNLYVPGIQGNATATWARIFTSLGTDPANNLITEFLPDIAKRVHVRVLFVQQIINQVARSGDN